MKTKLEELYERYERDGYPSRLKIQQDMAALVEEESKRLFPNYCPQWSNEFGCMLNKSFDDTLQAELLRFIDHRIATSAVNSKASPMIYPAEIKDILRRRGAKI